jgi:hypothetical protein
VSIGNCQAFELRLCREALLYKLETKFAAHAVELGSHLDGLQRAAPDSMWTRSRRDNKTLLLNDKPESLRKKRLTNLDARLRELDALLITLDAQANRPARGHGHECAPIVEELISTRVKRLSLRRELRNQ